MKEFTIGIKTKIFAWLIALVIIVLNIKLAIEEIQHWITSSNPNIFLVSVVIIMCMLITGLLLYIIFSPFAKAIMPPKRAVLTPHTLAQLSNFNLNNEISYSKIAITVDFSSMDSSTIQHAIKHGGKNASYTLIHIVETATARYLNAETFNYEALSDKDALAKYAKSINEQGYKCDYKIGYGNPVVAIRDIVEQTDAKLLIMGAHGHKLLKDIIFGSTIDNLRHKLNIPILIVTKSND